MKKRILLCFMAFIIFFQTVVYQPYQASAVGVDTVVKVVGGKAIIRSLAEKAGMSLSKKQVDNVSSYIERKTYDGDSKAIDFTNNINALTPVGDSETKSGFKKYVLDPFNWITGLDLIFGAVMAFQSGYDSGSPVPVFNVAECNDFFTNTGQTTTVDFTGKKWVQVPKFHSSYPNGQRLILYNGANAEWKVYLSGYGLYKPNDYWIYEMNTQNGGVNYWKLTGSGNYNDPAYPATSVDNISVKPTQSLGVPTCDKPIDYQPVFDDVVNITNVSQPVYNSFDGDTYNQNSTYVMNIEMPENPNLDDAEVWNEVDPNLENELIPKDPNAEPEEKPTASSWWEWLLKPLKVIGDFFADVGGFLLGILVPSADSVTGIFNGISDSFKAKIPIADQLGSFFGEIEEIQATETPTAPTFDVTMPVEWGGGTFPMIDFSYFDQWRNWVLNFIRFTAWFIFLKRLYARIPRMIY